MIDLEAVARIFKLKLFGVPGMSFAASKVVGWIYTVVVVGAVIAVARRSLGDAEKPLAWMAILILATLRSPFLPLAYGVFPSLWLLTLLAALSAPTIRTICLVLLGWLGLNILWPLDWPLDPRLIAVFNLVPQSLTIALAVMALRRRGESLVTSAEPAPRQAAPTW